MFSRAKQSGPGSVNIMIKQRSCPPLVSLRQSLAKQFPRKRSGRRLAPLKLKKKLDVFFGPRLGIGRSARWCGIPVAHSLTGAGQGYQPLSAGMKLRCESLLIQQSFGTVIKGNIDGLKRKDKKKIDKDKAQN